MHTNTSMFVAAAAMLALATPASAQPICIEMPPPIATEPLPVVLGVTATRGGKRLAGSEAEQTALRTILDALRARLTSPPRALPRITTSAPFDLIDSSRALYAPRVAHDYTFAVGADGRVVGLERGFGSVSASADSVFAAAVTALPDSTLQSAARVLGADVRVGVFTRVARPGAVREVTWMETPLHERELPLYRGSELRALPVARGLVYPRNRSGAREDGKAFASFAVGPDGRIDVKSIVIVEASAPEFAEASRAWLPSLRFRPKMIEGCPVRAMAGMPMTFSR